MSDLLFLDQSACSLILADATGEGLKAPCVQSFDRRRSRPTSAGYRSRPRDILSIVATASKDVPELDSPTANEVTVDDLGSTGHVASPSLSPLTTTQSPQVNDSNHSNLLRQLPRNYGERPQSALSTHSLTGPQTLNKLKPSAAPSPKERPWSAPSPKGRPGSAPAYQTRPSSALLPTARPSSAFSKPKKVASRPSTAAGSFGLETPKANSRSVQELWNRSLDTSRPSPKQRTWGEASLRPIPTLTPPRVDVLPPEYALDVSRLSASTLQLTDTGHNLLDSWIQERDLLATGKLDPESQEPPIDPRCERWYQKIEGVIEEATLNCNPKLAAKSTQPQTQTQTTMLGKSQSRQSSRTAKNSKMDDQKKKLIGQYHKCYESVLSRNVFLRFQPNGMECCKQIPSDAMRQKEIRLVEFMLKSGMDPKSLLTIQGEGLRYTPNDQNDGCFTALPFLIVETTVLTAQNIVEDPALIRDGHALLKIIRKMLSIVNQLHQAKVAHCALCPRAFALVEDQGRLEPRLTDFNFAFLTCDSTDPTYTLPHAPPLDYPAAKLLEESRLPPELEEEKFTRRSQEQKRILKLLSGLDSGINLQLYKRHEIVQVPDINVDLHMLGTVFQSLLTGSPTGNIHTQCHHPQIVTMEAADFINQFQQSNPNFRIRTEHALLHPLFWDVTRRALVLRELFKMHSEQAMPSEFEKFLRIGPAETSVDNWQTRVEDWLGAFFTLFTKKQQIPSYGTSPANQLEFFNTVYNFLETEADNLVLMTRLRENEGPHDLNDFLEQFCIKRFPSLLIKLLAKAAERPHERVKFIKWFADNPDPVCQEVAQFLSNSWLAKARPESAKRKKGRKKRN